MAADVLRMEVNEELMKFDDVFLGILQHLGKIEPFLESVFFFLLRRTDFFKLMHNRDDKMGFPSGVAERMIMQIFKKYQAVSLQNDPYAKKTKRSQESGGKVKSKESSVPVPGQKEAETQDVATCNKQEGHVPEAIQTLEVETSRPSGERVEPMSDIRDNEQPQDETKRKQEMDGVKKMEVSESKGPTPTDVADCYNGAVTDRYTWSQTSNDLDIKIPVPAFVKKSKDIGVEIRPDSIKVFLKCKPPTDSGITSNILLKGNLTKRIKCEESLWSLIPGECIQLNLEKHQGKYWTAVLEDEPEIDKNKIDTTKDISEFDEQTQSDFRRVMYDQQQKLQGKPTIQEQNTHDMLKQAWDVEGSPFKGTPFDPSKVNIASGSG